MSERVFRDFPHFLLDHPSHDIDCPSDDVPCQHRGSCWSGATSVLSNCACAHLLSLCRFSPRSLAPSLSFVVSCFVLTLVRLSAERPRKTRKRHAGGGQVRPRCSLGHSPTWLGATGILKERFGVGSPCARGSPGIHGHPGAAGTGQARTRACLAEGRHGHSPGAPRGPC